MTLVENLHANNAEPRRKYRKQPKAELRLLYPVVNDMAEVYADGVSGTTQLDSGSGPE